MFRRFGSEARAPQKKHGGTTAMVTMDDLFGHTSLSATRHTYSNHKEFTSDDVDLFSAPPTKPPQRFFQRKTKTAAASKPQGPSQSSFEAIFHGEPQQDQFEMSTTTASSTSTAQQQSQSSFEAVYNDENPDFEFDNPFLKQTSEQMKDAAVRVLYTDGDKSTQEEKSRMLFLLEQLKKPAPPVLPPKLVAEAPARARRQQQQPLRKQRIRNTAMQYNPTETALGLRNTTKGFLPLLLVIREFKQFGWRLRVEVLRDIAQQLKLLHHAGKTHNALHVMTNTLIVLDTFTGCLADENDTVKLSSSDVAQKRDVFMLGKLILLVCCSMSPAPTPDISAFHKIVDLEVKQEGAAQLEYEMCDLADSQVRVALAKALTPGSLLELCAQCCSGDHALRPNSEDTWDWLDSIVSDMHTASAGVILPEDQHEEMALQLQQISSLMAIKKPKLLELFADLLDDDDASSVNSDMSFASVETNDSFQPPPAAPTKSKLAGFLSKEEPPTTTRARSISDFLNESATVSAKQSLKTDGEEAWQQERTRRRSLDRGYMWAKSKLEEEEAAKLRKEKRKTYSKQLVGQDLSHFEEARYKVAAASKHTRKCEDLAKLFANQERIPQEEALGILKKAEVLLRKEKNLLELKPPVVIVGDIHGQFFDLINMLKLTGGPGGKSKTSYLFLGDYVDRGDFSCEVMLYLFALKCEFPDYVFLLRGNHECRTVSSYFGFKEECEMKYGPLVFNRCVQVFQVMPIAGLIDTLAGRFLCLHGGISPNFTSLEQFKEFDRFIEPGMNGFLCDILWSDPVKDGEEGESKLSLGEFLAIDYLPNPARGCSYRYGFKALVSFLAVNKLVCLIRAHEVQMGGYRYHFQELTGGNKQGRNVQMTPPVVTVFSAPNYTGKYGNLGAVLKLHAQPPGLVKQQKSNKLGFRPLELVEPIQYAQVNGIPPPMVLKSHHADQVLQITNTCPYMPTTFRAFIKSALEIAEEDNDEEILQRQIQRASRQLAPVTTTALQQQQTEIKAYEDSLEQRVANAERGRMSLGAKLVSAVGGSMKRTDSTKQKQPSPPLGDDVVAVPHGPAFVKQSDRLKTSKFEAAADNDGMNEMNPDLLAEKMERAQQRIAEKQLNLNADGVKVFIASNNEQQAKRSSKHAGGNRKSASTAGKLLVGDRQRPESQRNLKSSEPKETAATQPETIGEDESTEGAMSFTNKELLALQLLFLLIDREDKGLIDQEDLLAWSAEEGGYAVQPFEAEMCLKAVDSDEDGKIGFEDYLAFAARSKDRWLVAQYENVISASGVKELAWDSY